MLNLCLTAPFRLNTKEDVRVPGKGICAVSFFVPSASRPSQQPLPSNALPDDAPRCISEPQRD